MIHSASVPTGTRWPFHSPASAARRMNQAIRLLIGRCVYTTGDDHTDESTRRKFSPRMSLIWSPVYFRRTSASVRS